MAQVSGIFSQPLGLVPRRLFAAAVARHGSMRQARGFSCWDQFVAMLFCQLGQAQSLREICAGKHVDNLVKIYTNEELSPEVVDRVVATYKKEFADLQTLLEAAARRFPAAYAEAAKVIEGPRSHGSKIRHDQRARKGRMVGTLLARARRLGPSSVLKPSGSR